MTSQAFPFAYRFMYTLNTSCLFSLFMTVEAEFGRLISQHTVKLTGMHIVTRLAVALLDRFVLRCVRNVLMTGQTEPLIKGLYFNRGAFNEVTVIAVAISYRRVADLMGKIPADFDPVAIAGMQASETMGRAILSHAEQLGLYPHGTFAEMGVQPHELPEPAPARPNGNGGRILPWIGQFVHGRLVPGASTSAEDHPPN